MSSRLPQSFFLHDTRVVARELLGMHLVRLLPDGDRLCGIITETEAYRSDDAASHSYRGRTARNASMFLQAGSAYVYFTYGMYYCFNIVTEPREQACAVLVRSLEPVTGAEVMRQNRQRKRKGKMNGPKLLLRDLCRGPARLCQALAIDKSLDGINMLNSASTLFLEKGDRINDDLVGTSPRIGVRGDKAATDAEWRWYIKDNPYVSG